MVWYTEEFYWLPANDDVYGESIRLTVTDRSIELEMSDCKAKDYLDCKCEPECGYGNYCNRRLSFKELKQLKEACEQAIKFVGEH